MGFQFWIDPFFSLFIYWVINEDNKILDFVFKDDNKEQRFSFFCIGSSNIRNVSSVTLRAFFRVYFFYFLKFHKFIYLIR